MSTNSWYKTSGAPPFINQVLDIDTWTRYIEDYYFGKVAPNMIVLHNTWQPNQDNWNGLKSMKSMQTFYHNKVPSWSAGPHVYCAPDGIWLATPMEDIGVHAGACNSTRNAQGKLIGYSIGLEMVWDGSKSRPSGPVWNNTLAVLGELCQRMNKNPRQAITFHRNCGKASCPGGFVEDEWVWTEVERWLGDIHGSGLAAYYAKEGAIVYQGPSTTFPRVRALKLGEPVLVDTHADGFVHMARFVPMSYDEGFVEKSKLVRAF